MNDPEKRYTPDLLEALEAALVQPKEEREARRERMAGCNNWERWTDGE